MNVQCGLRRMPLDMHIEDYGLGILPAKYERELEDFFNTTDKREMQLRALRMKRVPILCPGNVIEIVEKDTGDLVQKVAGQTDDATIARELIAIAKDVLSCREV